MQQGRLVDNLNEGWYASQTAQSQGLWMEPEAGDVAPPLDGVWARAPAPAQTPRARTRSIAQKLATAPPA